MLPKMGTYNVRNADITYPFTLFMRLPNPLYLLLTLVTKIKPMSLIWKAILNF